MCKSWTKNGGLNLRVLERSTFMFYIEKSEELDLVMRKVPWNFDNNLLVTMRVLPSTLTSVFVFNTSPCGYNFETCL